MLTTQNRSTVPLADRDLRDPVKVALLVFIFACLAFMLYDVKSNIEQHKRQTAQEALAEKRAALKEWDAWAKWSHENCSVVGERDAPHIGGAIPMARYTCKNGISFEIPLYQITRARDCSLSLEEKCLNMPTAPILWRTLANRLAHE